MPQPTHVGTNHVGTKQVGTKHVLLSQCTWCKQDMLLQTCCIDWSVVWHELGKTGCEPCDDCCCGACGCRKTYPGQACC